MITETGQLSRASATVPSADSGTGSAQTSARPSSAIRNTSGQVDALAVDLVVANYYLAKQPDQFRILDETLAPEEYGIGFRKGEEAFKKAVEEALAEMKKDGTAAEISTKWFGKDVTTF